MLLVSCRLLKKYKRQWSLYGHLVDINKLLRLFCKKSQFDHEQSKNTADSFLEDEFLSLSLFILIGEENYITGK